MDFYAAVDTETIAALEERKLLYILGVRERTDKLVHEMVLKDDRPFVPLALARRGKDIEYGAKEVKIGNKRYIVCKNHDQAARDSQDHQAILESLKRQLKKGDKALVGCTGYRQFIRREGEGRFVIDKDRVAADAGFDGVFVLRTNTALPPVRRRCYATKSYGRSAETAAMLFWALVASGQITMRRVDGWQGLEHAPADPPLDLAA